MKKIKNALKKGGVADIVTLIIIVGLIIALIIAVVLPMINNTTDRKKTIDTNTTTIDNKIGALTTP